MPVDDFLTACQARGLSPRTVEYYGFFLDRLAGRFSDPLLASLPELRAFIASFSGWSVSSRRGLVRTLKLFFAHHGLADLAEALVMPRNGHRLPEVLSREQVAALLGAVRDSSRDWALVLVLLDGGVRVSELCGLQAPDLDLRQGWLLVRNGKGGRDRPVPLGSAVVAALVSYLGGRETGHVFLSFDGHPLRPEGVRKLLVRAGRRAGLSVRVHPHLLRHTCATLYLCNGGDAFTLQRVLGHSDPRVTEMYLALSKEMIRERFVRASPGDRAAEGIQARLWK